MSPPTPSDILAIALDLEAEWPTLCGSEWLHMKTQYQLLCGQLKITTGPVQMRIAAELMQLLEPHPEAYARLRSSLVARSIERVHLHYLCDIATQLGLIKVAENFSAAPKPNGQFRFIHQNTPSEAKSIKLGNMKLAFDNLSALGVFILTTISKEVIQQNAGILKAAGILAVIAMLYKAIEIKLTEKDATVFWGFALAQKQKEFSVKEDVILPHVNAERQTIGLGPLSQLELRQSLHQLEKLKSVERVISKDSAWRIIEKHDAK